MWRFFRGKVHLCVVLLFLSNEERFYYVISGIVLFWSPLIAMCWPLTLRGVWSGLYFSWAVDPQITMIDYLLVYFHPPQIQLLTTKELNKYTLSFSKLLSGCLTFIQSGSSSKRYCPWFGRLKHGCHLSNAVMFTLIMLLCVVATMAWPSQK